MFKRKWILNILVLVVMMVGTACSSNEVNAIDQKEAKKPVLEIPIKTDGEQNGTGIKEPLDGREEFVKVVQTIDNLNMRIGPSPMEPIILTIPAGEEVIVNSEIQSWYEISYQSEIGYIHSAYVKDIEAKGDSETTNIANRKEGFRVPILMYHAIDEFNGSGSQELFVTPEQFEKQMQYLKDEGYTPITFDDFPHVQEIEKPVMITLDDGYKNNLNAYHILKKLQDESFQPKATIFMIGKKIDKKSGLSTSDLQEMSDSGVISIQAHTESHPSLTTITTFEEELGRNKDRLEAITGKPITAIAYPAGHYDERVIEETKKYFVFAVTTNPGIATNDSSPYELERIRINYSTTMDGFIYLVEQ